MLLFDRIKEVSIITTKKEEEKSVDQSVSFAK